MDKLLDKGKFKRSFKNVCIIAGMILAFILTDLSLDLGWYLSPWYYALAFIFFALTIFLFRKIHRRLNFYDITQAKIEARETATPIAEADSTLTEDPTL